MKKTNFKTETRAMLLSNEIKTLKDKVEQMSKGVAMMDAEFFECVEVAEKNMILAL